MMIYRVLYFVGGLFLLVVIGNLWWGPVVGAIRYMDLPVDHQTLKLIVTGVALIGLSVLNGWRLRQLQMPVWLAVIGLIPVVNVLFLIILAILDNSPDEVPTSNTWTARMLGKLPTDPFGSALVGLLLTMLYGVPLTWVAVTYYNSYSWAVFVFLPFSLGFLTSLIYNFKRGGGFWMTLFLAFIQTVVVCIAVLAVAIEGIICVIMALPILFVLSWLGTATGYLFNRTLGLSRERDVLILALPVLIPGIFMADTITNPPEPTVHQVSTRVVVEAPVTVVWEQITGDNDFQPQRNPLYDLNVNLPAHLRIRSLHGRRLAVVTLRYGEKVAMPIRDWQENALVRFDVRQHTPVMEETSLNPDLRPPHVDRNFMPLDGAFRLRALSANRTELIGETRYIHRIWPQTYWRMWSDPMIDCMHHNALDYFKQAAERRYRASR